MCAKKEVKVKRTETKLMQVVNRTGLVAPAVHHHHLTAAIHHCCCAMPAPSLETGRHRHLAPLSLPCPIPIILVSWVKSTRTIAQSTTARAHTTAHAHVRDSSIERTHRNGI
jgi:hypothetical protein